VVYSQNEKYDTSIDFTCVYKIWNKCRFFIRNGGLFWGFVSDLAQVNFLKSLFNLTNREKNLTGNFSSFFQLFAFLSKNRKKSTFFRFICSASLIDSYQNSVGLDFLRRLSIGDLLVTCIWIWRLVPLPPGLFHYGVFWKRYQRNTESSKSKQKIQGDQQFLQAKFSGSKNRSFRKKLALILFQIRGNQNEWTGNRYHYSRLRERHIKGYHVLFVVILITCWWKQIFFFNSRSDQPLDVKWWLAMFVAKA